jgi:hypothetical protein
MTSLVREFNLHRLRWSCRMRNPAVSQKKHLTMPTHTDSSKFYSFLYDSEKSSATKNLIYDQGVPM